MGLNRPVRNPSGTEGQDLVSRLRNALPLRNEIVNKILSHIPTLALLILGGAGTIDIGQP